MENKKLNKFEKTRLLSSRAYEIAKGAEKKTEIENEKIMLSKDYVKVAQKEFEEGSIELQIFKK
jgi:DNA-directed RNA polymerase subunit K/omega